MIRIHKILVSTFSHYRGIVNNISWLVLLNILNVFVPYMTLPYVARILSPSGFGNFSFAISSLTYFIAIIDYGFNLTGVKEIAKVKYNDLEKMSSIYYSIIIIRLIFLLIITPVLIMFVLYIPALYQIHLLIFILWWILLATAISSSWFFQGIQQCRIFTLICLLIRILFMITVFIFVNSSEDIYIYAILYVLSQVSISVLSFCYIRFSLNIKIRWPLNISLRRYLIDGFYVFISSFFISASAATSTFLLGIFTNTTLVGYYSGIVKINQAYTMSYYPIGQGIFPYISKNFHEKGWICTIKQIVFICKLIIPLYLLGSVAIIILRKTLVIYLYGAAYAQSADLLLCMGFIPVISIVSNLTGTQILVASEHTKEYSVVFTLTFIIFVTSSVLFGWMWGIWGIACASVIGVLANVLLNLLAIYKINKNKMLLN